MQNKRGFNIFKEFIGYHGTSGENAASILKLNFISSENHNDWLGNGVYFFIDRISCAKCDAQEWAINQSWDNKNKCNKYKTYSVIQASLKVPESGLLDLTTQEGLVAFNKVRDILINKYASLFYYGRDKKEDDCKICNMTIDMMRLHALINFVYIKNKTQRTKKISSSIPNVTIMSVVKPETCIEFASIKQIRTGVI